MVIDQHDMHAEVIHIDQGTEETATLDIRPALLKSFEDVSIIAVLAFVAVDKHDMHAVVILASLQWVSHSELADRK